MINILVIEDDSVMLRGIESILKKSGYNVSTAKNGKEALEQIESATFDLVITDLMIPYSSGFEIISKLRADSEKNKVLIMVMSHVGGENSIVDAFNFGADEYIKKPILVGELLVRIKRLLESKMVTGTEQSK